MEERLKIITIQLKEDEFRRYKSTLDILEREKMERETDLRMQMEKNRELERAVRDKDVIVNELQSSYSDMVRDNKMKEQTISMMMREIQQYKETIDNSVFNKDNEISLLRRESVSSRVVIEEVERRRKIEVDQLIKKHEVEKKHHGLLIDNLKNRVYQLENTVQEMSRVIKILNQNSVSPNPVHN